MSFLLFHFLSLASHADFNVGPQSLFSVAGEPEPGFSSEASAGLNLVRGNTRTSRYEFRDRVTYRWTEETLQAQLRYLEASASDVQNAKSWGAGSRYERRIVRRLGGFLGHTLEADRFAGYRQRHSSDLGLRRAVWSTERSAGAIEAGYRHQIEKRIDGSTKVSPITRIYGETRYRFRESVSGLLLLEFLPDVNDSTNWMVNTSASVEAEIARHLSLKTTYAMKFDNVPAEAGLRKTDRSLITALVARF